MLVCLSLPDEARPASRSSSSSTALLPRVFFLAILGKRLGRAPEGWRSAAEPFSDDKPRSVADVDSEESLLAVRNWKKAMKARGKSKQD